MPENENVFNYPGVSSRLLTTMILVFVVELAFAFFSNLGVLFFVFNGTQTTTYQSYTLRTIVFNSVYDVILFIVLYLLISVMHQDSTGSKGSLLLLFPFFMVSYLSTLLGNVIYVLTVQQILSQAILVHPHSLYYISFLNQFLLPWYLRSSAQWWCWLWKSAGLHLLHDARNSCWILSGNCRFSSPRRLKQNNRIYGSVCIGHVH